VPDHNQDVITHSEGLSARSQPRCQRPVFAQEPSAPNWPGPVRGRLRDMELLYTCQGPASMVPPWSGRRRGGQGRPTCLPSAGWRLTPSRAPAWDERTPGLLPRHVGKRTVRRAARAGRVGTAPAEAEPRVSAFPGRAWERVASPRGSAWDSFRAAPGVNLQI
jgi:hypothetical protein